MVKTYPELLDWLQDKGLPTEGGGEAVEFAPEVDTTTGLINRDVLDFGGKNECLWRVVDDENCENV